MTRFVEWCAHTDIPVAHHKLQILTADPAKLAAAVDIVAEVVPDHYVMPGRLAQLLTRLGRKEVAVYVAEKLPTTKQIKSGDLGEILCTTFIHESTPFKLGIKRLRWKDHRNMSMRGDDVLAFHIGAGAAGLQVLKAEAKSGGKMQAGTVSTARDALSAYGELPSPHAMSFVADRLEAAVDKPLRDMLDDAQLKRNLKPAHVTHMLFTFSGNDTTAMLSKNLASYVGGSAQHYVGIRVEDHQAFIKSVFAAAEV
ncbi:Hachiman antiphage defense system protein HamA [Polaromonas naphthalenivorans]|uniref:Anti-bacteriophage protein A/HamA C-terminal domain-containing protein n=1 Tax=Polaromonas naphthalenivorans (strain CJ2) TaxID=365044 RepID=A1VVI3_POLNA|nr:Hachiman antiphage defense system protein HamA [Polaromonas naphthalenivorans]ABM39661.1 conserved hypothetical protein [Polaromonas naphthalenivorans CJ2]